MVGKARFNPHRTDVEAHLLQLLDDDVARHLLEGDRKVWALHLPGERGRQAVARAFVAADVNAIARIVGGKEKWKALDMIPMRVGDEEVDLDRLAVELLGQRLAQRPDAGTGVEDNDLTISADFDARGVATKKDRGLTGRRDRSAHPPEFHPRGLIGDRF